MPTNHPFDKKKFERGWILANVLGAIAGVILSFGIFMEFMQKYWYLPGVWLEDLEKYLIAANNPFTTPQLAGMLVGSLLIGWGEQVLIRRHTPLKIPWFRATACGYLIGVALFFIQIVLFSIYLKIYWSLRSDFPLLYGLSPSRFWFYFFIALSIYFSQWFVLKKTIPHAGAWIWIRILSALSFLLVFFACGIFAFGNYDAITGRAMEICSTIRQHVCADGKVYFVLIYLFCLVAMPIPAAISAWIRAAFIQNRLKKASQNLVLSPEVEEPVLDIPLDGKQALP